MEAAGSGARGWSRRFWTNFWGRGPDLHLETRWQILMAFWGLDVSPPARQDRLHIRPRFLKVVGVFAAGIPRFLVTAGFKTSASALPSARLLATTPGCR